MSKRRQLLSPLPPHPTFSKSRRPNQPKTVSVHARCHLCAFTKFRDGGRTRYTRTCYVPRLQQSSPLFLLGCMCPKYTALAWRIARGVKTCRFCYVSYHKLRLRQRRHRHGRDCASAHSLDFYPRLLVVVRRSLHPNFSNNDITCTYYKICSMTHIAFDLHS